MKKWSKVILVMTLAVLVTLGVAVEAEEVYTDDFEGGANGSGWVFTEGVAITTLETAGGNPGGWLKGEYPEFLTTPVAKTTVGADTPFHGDYTAAGVTSITVDAIHIENQYGVDISGYGMTGSLYLRDNDSGMAAVAPLNTAGFGDPTATWFGLTIPIDSQAASTPANWSDAGGGLDWPTLMQGVDQVELDWWDPDASTIGMGSMVGIDNMSISYVGGGDGGGAVVPATNTWGLMVLVGLFMGISIFYLRKRTA